MLKYLSAMYAYQAPSKLPWIHSDVKVEPLGRSLSETEGYQVIPRYYDFLRDVSRDSYLFITETVLTLTVMQLTLLQTMKFIKLNSLL